MFEGDSADRCAGKFLLMSMGGRVEGLAGADPVVRTPIRLSGNSIYSYLWKVDKWCEQIVFMTRQNWIYLWKIWWKTFVWVLFSSLQNSYLHNRKWNLLFTRKLFYVNFFENEVCHIRFWKWLNEKHEFVPILCFIIKITSYVVLKVHSGVAGWVDLKYCVTLKLCWDWVGLWHCCF